MTMPYQQPVPPPPRRRHTLRTVLIIVGAVLVVCLAGAVVGGVFLFRNVMQSTAPARQAADDFITDLESGNATAAYGRLCAGTQSQFTLQAFTDGLGRQSKIRSHEVQGVRVSNVNGKVSGTVVADLTLDTGFVDQHTFRLVKEGGQWKVCGQPY